MSTKPADSRNSVLARIRKAQLEIERLRRAGPGFEGAQAVIADMIGNAYHELGDPQAADWYKQAIELFHAVSTRPSVRTALLLWKRGCTEEMRHECARVLDAAPAVMNLPSEESDSSEPQRWFRELCFASFLRGSYDEAAVRAREGIGRGAEGSSEVLRAIAEMASGLSAQDASRFSGGVAALRRSVKEWPSAVSGQVEDLLRYALWLQAQQN